MNPPPVAAALRRLVPALGLPDTEVERLADLPTGFLAGVGDASGWARLGRLLATRLGRDVVERALGGFADDDLTTLTAAVAAAATPEALDRACAALAVAGLRGTVDPRRLDVTLKILREQRELLERVAERGTLRIEVVPPIVYDRERGDDPARLPAEPVPLPGGDPPLP